MNTMNTKNAFRRKLRAEEFPYPSRLRRADREPLYSGEEQDSSTFSALCFIGIAICGISAILLVLVRYQS